MKKVMITLLILILASLSLFATDPSFHDSNSFYVDVVIRHAFSSTLEIRPMQEGDITNQVRSIGVTDASTEYGVCQLRYTTNIVGQNTIFIQASPLYHVDPSNNYIEDDPTLDGIGYELKLVSNYDVGNETIHETKYQTIQGGYDIDVNNNNAHVKVNPTNIYITFDVPYFLNSNYSSTVDLYATFTDMRKMAAGSYRGTIIVGQEGQ